MPVIEPSTDPETLRHYVLWTISDVFACLDRGIISREQALTLIGREIDEARGGGLIRPV